MTRRGRSGCCHDSRFRADPIHTQCIGDLVQIYLIAERDGLDYNLAYIPPSFKAPHRKRSIRPICDSSFRWATTWRPRGIRG